MLFFSDVETTVNLADVHLVCDAELMRQGVEDIEPSQGGAGEGERHRKKTERCLQKERKKK